MLTHLYFVHFNRKKLVFSGWVVSTNNHGSAFVVFFWRAWGNCSLLTTSSSLYEMENFSRFFFFFLNQCCFRDVIVCPSSYCNTITDCDFRMIPVLGSLIVHNTGGWLTTQWKGTASLLISLLCKCCFLQGLISFLTNC